MSNKCLCSPGIVTICWSSPSCWLCTSQSLPIISDAGLALLRLGGAPEVLQHYIKILSCLSTLCIESPFFLLASWLCMLGEKCSKEDEMFSQILSVVHPDLPLFLVWTIITISISPLHTTPPAHMYDLFYLLCSQLKVLGIWESKCWHSQSCDLKYR